MAKYETALTTDEERAFQAWKSKYAAKDDGSDYDLRGAFKAGVTPNDQGHWPDTFKKPNHPTFSNESVYAKDAPDKAGRWVPGPNGTKTYVGANGRTDADLLARMGGDGRTIAGTETGAFRDSDKAAFDSRFTANGIYDPYKADRIPFPRPSASVPASIAQTGSAQTAGSGAAATAPVVAPVPKGSANVLSGIPSRFDAKDAPLAQTFGGKPLNLSLGSNAPAIAPTPSAAENLGSRIGTGLRSFAGRMLDRGTGLVRSAVADANAAVPDTTPPEASYAGSPLERGATAVQDFTTGLGRSIASGVSRSQAADFRQPTKANPLPVTPTSPVANVDKSPESVSRFGLTDDEFAKNKLAFAGF